MFTDRFDAGQQLAAQLQQYKDNPDVVILAIPRGALQIGSVLAKELHAPLEVLFSKKIGAPEHEEMAIGAVTLDNIIIDPVFKDIYTEYIDAQIPKIRALLKKRQQLYYGTKKPLDLKNKIVILTDDGIATGKTFLLALDLVRKQHPKKIIAAIPVAPPQIMPEIGQHADEVIVILQPDPFYAVGRFYGNFDQVDDEQAIQLLREANA